MLFGIPLLFSKALLGSVAGMPRDKSPWGRGCGVALGLQNAGVGAWAKRSAQVRQVWVHPNELKSMPGAQVPSATGLNAVCFGQSGLRFSSSGWVCDGRDFTGGCRSGPGPQTPRGGAINWAILCQRNRCQGQTDFHQTNVVASAIGAVALVGKAGGLGVHGDLSLHNQRLRPLREVRTCGVLRLAECTRDRLAV